MRITLLDYHIFQPLSPTANPQVLFLLSYGSHEKDLFSFANYLPEDYRHFLSSALNLNFGSYAWYSIHFNEN